MFDDQLRIRTQASVIRAPLRHVFAQMHEIEMGKSSYKCAVHALSYIYVFEITRTIPIGLEICSMLKWKFVLELHSDRMFTPITWYDVCTLGCWSCFHDTPKLMQQTGGSWCYHLPRTSNGEVYRCIGMSPGLHGKRVTVYRVNFRSHFNVIWLATNCLLNCILASNCTRQWQLCADNVTSKFGNV